MIIYISGGVRSGKSRFAQEMALGLSREPVYVATAKIWDDDFAERVNRHRQERGGQWTTHETGRDIYKLPLGHRTVVIDCVTLWLTGFFMDYDHDTERSLQDFKTEMDGIRQLPGTFIIISNEIGMGVHADSAMGRKFADLQGMANQYVAGLADEAIFMVSGIPLYLKKYKTMSEEILSAGSNAADPVKEKTAVDHKQDDWQAVPEHPRSFNESLRKELRNKIDGKTKPLGALGVLESLALQIGEVFGTSSPALEMPHIIVFAADHGIAGHGVSAYPQEVTAQMVMNFVYGGAAINVFCRQHGISLVVVDAGVNYDFAPDLPIVNYKTGKGTASFLLGPAMEQSQVHDCLSKGGELVRQLHGKGCNTIGLGEMGIGNTSTAAVLMSMLCDIPVEDCIGRGTGVTDEKLAGKRRILRQAVDNYHGGKDVYSIMAYFGGYEIVQMAGAMLEAYKNNMLILVDGFISTVAFLCAYKIEPAVKQNAVFCHQSGEHGHQRLLAVLDATPLLHLNMRLGEGTGAAVAFPVIQSAVTFLHEMASFESAGVSKEAE